MQILMSTMASIRVAAAIGKSRKSDEPLKGTLSDCRARSSPAGGRLEGAGNALRSKCLAESCSALSVTLDAH